MAKKHMGKCSKSLVLREIKLTATTKYRYMPSKMFIKKKKGKQYQVLAVWQFL